jgi:MerR family mercuric resistance operon transcriptional regulator
MKKATIRLPQSEIEAGFWLKIGEVSKRSGVGVEALRFYERSGLIDPPGRTGGGYRQYDASVLDRLEFIKRAQALGFSLNEIAQIIAEKRDGHRPCEEVREIVRARLRELDERMAQMRRYRREMAETLKGWDQSGGVDGDFCGLIEGSEIRNPINTNHSVEKIGIKKRSR